MLAIDLSVVDTHGRRSIYVIKAVRGEAHRKLPHHFHYSYMVNVDGRKYTGSVIHKYDNGAIALTAKITKAIVSQQKAERAAK